MKNRLLVKTFTSIQLVVISLKQQISSAETLLNYAEF